MTKKTFFILLGFTVVFTACRSTDLFVSDEMELKQDVSVPPESDLLYSVFLVGDAGENVTESEIKAPTLQLLGTQLAAAGEQSAVVFLGDNIYPAGLPPEGDPGRTEAEQRLVRQLKAVQNHPGRIVFIPGNHDWNDSRPGGLEAVKRQEAFVENYLNRGDTFVPDNGYPGPVDLKLLDEDEAGLDGDIRLIVIDTEWWLGTHEKPFGDTGEYELSDAGDFLQEFRDLIQKRENDHLIVVGHHPLFSNGSHGGYFAPARHFTPPVFGTLYVLYRKFFGLPQDISHYRYQEMKRELLEIFSIKYGLVYASGHQHNLQYFLKGGTRFEQHHIVSGAVSKTDYTARGMGVDFTSEGPGFMVIRYYQDGSSWLEAWTPQVRSEGGKMLFRTPLALPESDPFYNTETDSLPGAYPDYTDSTVTMAANPDYDKPGMLHRLLLGSHNRHLWSIPVEVPVFDIGSVEGGLEAVKLGGVGQSNTLRLRNGKGREFVLRSTDKVAGKIWDEQLRNTLAHDLAQDQFAILNPYGAYMIPPLAEAIGIYHAKPRLYFIPDDPRLGEFADLAAGEFALFEERPDDDMSHAPHFGRSEDVIGTPDMLSEVENDLDHQVDQGMMLRNRLFDMWISDWDRHEDQWRWASFEPYELDSTLVGDERTSGKIYRPIPRDRDVAFLFMNGIIPSLGKLTTFHQYQDFRERYGNLKGLTYNSLALTRRFTNDLSREEWQAIAEEVEAGLSDEVIDEAISKLPEEVRKVEGDKIRHLMRERREKLPEIANGYYEILSKVVDVVGSHKNELFVIDRLDAERTEIKVYKRTGEGELRGEFYNRTFHNSETDEIRVYGLGGDDVFEIRGDYANATLIRIVGGQGSDRFIAAGSPGHSLGRIKLYDTADGNQWTEVEGPDIHRSDRAAINRYDYKRGYQYNSGEPILFFGHNKDDGVFIGGGAALRLHGFRKNPYAASHKIRANVAARTGAFNIRYAGEFIQVAGEWDAHLNVDVLTPNNIRNFLGLGNETRETVGNDNYYKARLWQYRVASSVHRDLGTGIEFSLGPYFQVTNVREDDGRFITQPQAGISQNTFEDQWYSGVRAELELKGVDNSVNPKQGFRWSGEADYNLGIKNTSDNHATLGSELAIYVSPLLKPQLTVAARVGARHNIGEFPFYKANALGGTRNFRGLRSTRYNGRTSFYNNLELRSKLFDFNNYLLGGEFGLLGFLDHGRVWTDGENSDKWHFGYGGGAWVSVFRAAVIRGSIGFSEDEWNVLVGAGFFF